MPAYWMISDRKVQADGFGPDRAPLTYWTSDVGGLDQFKNWTKVSAANFQKQLVAAADQFPPTPHDQHEDQPHVCFFVHGYNNGWQDAARRYEKVCAALFSGQEGLGLCISFDWPSRGNVLGYLPDRA